MADEETRDDDLEAMDSAVDSIANHFENVLIFASRFDPETGNTISAWRGRGNWHARHGQVREWLVKQDAQARIEQSRACDDDND